MGAAESVLRPVNHGVRHVRRRPGASASVIVTLGVAIGAQTAIFSFVNALIIRPFPFRDPDQLVEIRSIRGGQPGKVSMLEILDMQQQISMIDSIAAHTGDAGGYNFSGDGGRPEEWKTILTPDNPFEVRGVPLAAGAPWPQPQRHVNAESGRAEYRGIFNVVLRQRSARKGVLEQPRRRRSHVSD